MSYVTVANTVVDRIRALASSHPEVLTMQSPWDLFTVKGFDVSDLEPSLFQVSWALQVVQREHAKAAK